MRVRSGPGPGCAAARCSCASQDVACPLLPRGVQVPAGWVWAFGLRCSVFAFYILRGLLLFLESKFLEELPSLPALTWPTPRPAPSLGSLGPGPVTMALPPGPATLPHSLLLLPALLSSGTPLLVLGHALLGSGPPLSPPCLPLRFGYPLKAPGPRAALLSPTYPRSSHSLVREPGLSTCQPKAPL